MTPFDEPPAWAREAIWDLIALRKKRPEPVHGDLEYLLVDDQAMTLAYRRT